MPIYEYQCQACGHAFEALQKFADEALKDCPACSQTMLQKRVSAAGFRLKGGGWYETDFKGDSRKKKNLIGDESVPKKSSPESSSTAKETPKKTASPDG